MELTEHEKKILKFYEERVKLLREIDK